MTESVFTPMVAVAVVIAIVITALYRRARRDDRAEAGRNERYEERRKAS